MAVILKTLIFKISGFCVVFGHSALLLRIRNSMLRSIGLDLAIGSGIDRDFDFLMVGGQISIGEHSIIGIHNHFWNYSPITVGRYCMFAADVTLTNGGHDKSTLEPFSGALIIGSGCWIGSGAKVVGPLSIGDNAIIAAGAVVVRDVPNAAIVAGVPARAIGYRELPERVWHLGDSYYSPRSFEEVE
jgi:acetyltransferase-like isoleucine patch superfamily enzyme